MEILAFGVQADEKPLIERAFKGHHDIHCLGVFLMEDTAPIAAGHEIVSTSVNAGLGAPVLSVLAAGGTRMVAQRSTGFNNIDLDVAERLGITVARVSYYSPYAVAEFAWTLAMAVNRRVVRASTRTRDFHFRLDGLMGRDMYGRTAGVIGAGKIGEAFARIAHGFGMRLLGWDIAENPECMQLGMAYVPKERLLAESDLVTLHVPLMPETRHLIDADALRTMRDDAILINSSRGGLGRHRRPRPRAARGPLHGCGSRRVRGGGRAVLPRQVPAGRGGRHPRPPRHLPNVLVTSHQAYYTEDAVGQIVDTTVRNVLDYIAGRRSGNVLVPRS
ncbi:NAD(P)-dependent oxidoreductase [Streptomyces sp. NPDC059861]|uniref:NAD(P)-dependent oxidoreductase n=1 Tax=Streptomyces sp. NPDC059861 TaxID=3346974 RepID=UPI003647B264